MKNKRAFTLAEVLITLSILGVVAAISIPNIIQQYQKRLTITKLQKAYATLEQAVDNIAINTGCVGRDLKCTGLLEYTNNMNSDLLAKFFELANLKVNKKFGGVTYNAMNYEHIDKRYGGRYVYNVWTDKNNIGYSMAEGSINLNSSPATSVRGIYVQIFTKTSFDKYHEGLDGGGDKRKFLDDIKEGYDVFQFLIYDNFIVEPNAGCSGGTKIPLSKAPSFTGSTCSKTYTTNCYGNTCAARIIRDGWKMNY